MFYLQKRFMDGKFGSSQPYEFTDPTFGIVSLRVFGEYRWRVSSPENFINQFRRNVQRGGLGRRRGQAEGADGDTDSTTHSAR